MVKPVAALLLFFTCFSTNTALKLPWYIKACSASDPKVSECATKHGQEAIPNFINGDRKYKIPPLNPLEITELVVAQGTEQVGLKIRIFDAKLYGMDKTIVRGVKIDLPNKQFTWDLKIPKVTMLSGYNITGKILLLPLFGEGACNITLIDPTFVYRYGFTLEKRKGVEYMNCQKGEITYELNQGYVNLDNLFNGDKLLGPQMNKFLNENWKDAARELGPSIVQGILKVIDGILSSICETVPYKDVFLP